MALSVEPCLEAHKTAKPAIHGRSVYNLHRPLPAKQPAQIHPGPLRGGEEQSNYILKQQSESRSACKQTSGTHTNTVRFRHKQYICSRLCSVLLSLGFENVWPIWCCVCTLQYSYFADMQPQVSSLPHSKATQIQSLSQSTFKVKHSSVWGLHVLFFFKKKLLHNGPKHSP